jgi:pimeloyl-ACP methyl ester carboxylesterase/class 3 adenylate cyclase
VAAPDVRYAKSGDLSIAYQVLGNGPVDLLYVPGFISHLDLYWQEPTLAQFLQRLGAGFRLIMFDRRGTGLSDRFPEGDPATLETRMDDIRAVLDAVGSREAAIFAQGYGCPIAVVFAATYPSRTRSLVLYSPAAKAGLKTDDYPWGSTEEEDLAWHRESERSWGTEEFARAWLPRLAPSADGDPSQIDWIARVMRAAGTPTASRRFGQANAGMDVRAVLPLVRVPTLVLVRRDAVAPKGGIDVESLPEARYVAERISGSKLVTVPGRDYLPWIGDQESLIAEIASFASSTEQASVPDRVLLTVLFTDIVDSTAALARLGDRRWREVLAAHDDVTSRAIERHRGREIDHTGDGTFATFDGPARAVQCAHEILRELRAEELDLRAGVHTGECEVDGNRVSGITVHTGARIAALAGRGEILVSRIVTELVAGSGLGFAERGVEQLKGVPGHWTLFSVDDSTVEA